MNLSVSPQVRIAALVGLLAVLGLAVSVMLMTRKQDSSSPSAAPEAPARAQSPATPTPAPAPAKPDRPVVRPAQPKVHPAVQNALRAGLPAEIAGRFANHDVVLVELYSAEAPLDQLALTEATAGARTAGVGFVAVDVTSAKDVTTRALVTKLGVLNSPTLLVYRRPGTLFAQLGGFSDHETVAQAAVNAATSIPAGA